MSVNNKMINNKYPCEVSIGILKNQKNQNCARLC